MKAKDIIMRKVRGLPTTPDMINKVVALLQDKNTSARDLGKLIYSVLSILAYILSFICMHYFFGQAEAFSAIIPVIAMGWLYGSKAGVFCALLCFPANSILYTLFGLNWFEKLILSGGGAAGNIALIVIGVTVGRMSSLNMHLKEELYNRKRAEEKLNEAKDYLDNAFENSLDAIIISDNNGYLTRINKSFLKMIGVKEDEIIGKHLAELSPLEEGNHESTTGESLQIGREYLDNALVFAAKLLEEGKIANYESYNRSDKKVVPVESNMSLLYNEKGEQLGAIGIIRDITERKKMEKQLFQSEKLRSLGELAGGVAHDFNNVLAAILGRAQLLKMCIKTTQEKEERRKSVIEMKRGLEIIEQAALDGAETVRRIQEFSRKREDDKYFRKVDLNEIIEHALEFTQSRWKDDAESKGIKIRIVKELSPLSPTAGCASELREVFTNLINNALDAMPQGGQIKIKTFKENSHISIEVEDTGTGIPESIRNRIFDPFFTTKGVQSTGLGMSVSYGIINRHKGTVKVDGVEGEGTTFTIKLPIIKDIGKEEGVKPMPDKKRKASILVIEDEEEVRNLLSDILIKGGHDVEIAIDGSKGVEMFKEKKFDLVFTDLGMPGMSGWQVAEKIKSIKGGIPVAMITGWGITLEEPQRRESGVDLIIKKPFHVDQVLRLVQEGMALNDRFKEV